TVHDCPDFEDNLILDLAVETGAFLVVSEDSDLTAMSPWRGTPILRPGEFALRVNAMRRARRRRETASLVLGGGSGMSGWEAGVGGGERGRARRCWGSVVKEAPGLRARRASSKVVTAVLVSRTPWLRAWCWSGRRAGAGTGVRTVLKESSCGRDHCRCRDQTG